MTLMCGPCNASLVFICQSTLRHYQRRHRVSLAFRTPEGPSSLGCAIFMRQLLYMQMEKWMDGSQNRGSDCWLQALTFLHKVPKSPKFRDNSEVTSEYVRQHHKSTLNTISSAIPWPFCHDHLWTCHHVVTASCASTFTNDLQFRVHLATLIILILIGSTAACLFQGAGWTEEHSRELKMNVESLLTEENCQCGCCS